MEGLFISMAIAAGVRWNAGAFCCRSIHSGAKP